MDGCDQPPTAGNDRQERKAPRGQTHCKKKEITELLRLLVFEFRVISYEYFCDNLQPYELAVLIDGLPYLDRNTWEQTRVKVFSTASMFSKQKPRLTDIMQFAWDEEKANTELPKEITETEINDLRQQAKQFERF